MCRTLGTWLSFICFVFLFFVFFPWLTVSAHWGDALCARDFCPQTRTFTEHDKSMMQSMLFCSVLIKHNREITKQQHRAVTNEAWMGVMTNMVSEHCQCEWQCQTSRQMDTSPLTWPTKIVVSKDVFSNTMKVQCLIKLNEILYHELNYITSLKRESFHFILSFRKGKHLHLHIVLN